MVYAQDKQVAMRTSPTHMAIHAPKDDTVWGIGHKAPTKALERKRTGTMGAQQRMPAKRGVAEHQHTSKLTAFGPPPFPRHSYEPSHSCSVASRFGALVAGCEVSLGCLRKRSVNKVVNFERRGCPSMPRVGGIRGRSLISMGFVECCGGSVRTAHFTPAPSQGSKLLSVVLLRTSKPFGQAPLHFGFH